MTKPPEFSRGAENSKVMSLAAPPADVAYRHVELRQIVVVLLHDDQRPAHRRALLPHLPERLLADAPREVVAHREHDHEERVGHRSDDLGQRRDIHARKLANGWTTHNRDATGDGPPPRPDA
jgi:hypothetical protein